MGFTASLVVLLLATVLVLGGCAAPRMTTGAFRDTQSIEASFKRGVSTAEDVKRILGEPNGRGEFFLAMLGKPRDIWYYEDVEITGITPVGQGNISVVAPPVTRTLKMSMRQQILLVFFEGNRYDGLMWSSNAIAANGWVR